MKFTKSAIFAVAVSACAFGASATAGFTVDGEIAGLPDSVKVILFDTETKRPSKIAEAMSSNGRFTLSGEMKSPRICNLSFQRYDNAKKRYVPVTAVKVMMDNDAYKVASESSFDAVCESGRGQKHINVTGGRVQAEFNSYNNAVGDLQYEAEQASYLNAHKFFESNDNPDTMAVYDRMKKDAELRLMNANMDFIRKNPSYDISAYVAYQQIATEFVYTDDQLVEMACLVSQCADTARIGKINRRLKFSRRFTLDMSHLEFDVTSPEGVKSAFASHVEPGKLTFIDFWASWCGPCRAAIPHVREIHSRYADRIKVVSVSIDEDESAWREALANEKMPWTQFHLNGEEQLGKAAEAYCINSIPRLILISAEGRVICSTNNPSDIDRCIEKHLGNK